MIQYVENQWLTWQRATKLVNADYALNVYQTAPERLGNYYPNWFKNLKADVRTYLPQGVGQKNLTARVCLGLRGINNLGWTLKTPWDMDRGGAHEFHPEQLHGTRWSEKDENGEYIWGIYLIKYPWRAKMAKGFRLLISDYPLEFSTEWYTFSGCVDANYRIDENGQLGGMYWYDEPIDLNFDYFNVETVVAIKKGYDIPAGVVSFVITPVWDPDYSGIDANVPHFG